MKIAFIGGVKISLDESTETNANKIISQNDIRIYLGK